MAWSAAAKVRLLCLSVRMTSSRTSLLTPNFSSSARSAGSTCLSQSSRSDRSSSTVRAGRAVSRTPPRRWRRSATAVRTTSAPPMPALPPSEATASSASPGISKPTYASPVGSPRAHRTMWPDPRTSRRSALYGWKNLARSPRDTSAGRPDRWRRAWWLRYISFGGRSPVTSSLGPSFDSARLPCTPAHLSNTLSLLARITRGRRTPILAALPLAFFDLSMSDASLAEPRRTSAVVAAGRWTASASMRPKWSSRGVPSGRTVRRISRGVASGGRPVSFTTEAAPPGAEATKSASEIPSESESLLEEESLPEESDSPSDDSSPPAALAFISISASTGISYPTSSTGCSTASPPPAILAMASLASTFVANPTNALVGPAGLTSVLLTPARAAALSLIVWRFAGSSAPTISPSSSTVGRRPDTYRKPL
mmetsp:Transcript_22019/g.49944  ORF Transcript_22019/g.49944 Transcript_22019/m.49944 type:complete len:425 (+) Transcript_22019:371-1645(+)